MIEDKVQELFSRPNRHHTALKKIKYLEILEKKGLIEPPVSQTVYKYPPNILPNSKIKKVP